jgi:hypothetical protein
MISLIRLLLTLMLICALIIGFVSPKNVAADDPPGSHVTLGENKERTSFEAVITTNEQGIWIEVHVQQTVPGRSVSGAHDNRSPSHEPSAESPPDVAQTVRSEVETVSWYDPLRGYFSRTPDGHVYSLEGVNISNAGLGWLEEGFRQHPDSVPMSFSIDGVFQGIVWIPIDTDPENVNWGAPPTLEASAPIAPPQEIDPREVALELLNHIPLPEIQINMNPSLGLVGMPGWFWVEGYDGRAFGDAVAVSLPPEIGPEVALDEVPADDPRREGEEFTVAVRVWPIRYEWSFGDGTRLVTESLGTPYPTESEIQHTYEYSSLWFPSGFPVRLSVEFAAEFQVNGGPSERLSSMLQTYETAYPVQESQPVLTAP